MVNLPCLPNHIGKPLYFVCFCIWLGSERYQGFHRITASLRPGYFSRQAALDELRLSPETFQMAAARMTKEGLLVSPRRGFYLILRPEDRTTRPILATGILEFDNFADFFGYTQPIAIQHFANLPHRNLCLNLSLIFGVRSWFRHKPLRPTGRSVWGNRPIPLHFL